MYKKHFSLPALALAVILTALFTFQITFVTMRLAYKEQSQNASLLTNEDAKKLETIAALLEKYCLFTVDSNLSANEAFAAYLEATGDRYAYYFTKEEYAEYLAGDDGNAVGIGVTITDHEKGLLILSVSLGSPAEKAGLTAGEVIEKVDEITLAGMEYRQKADLLLGEEGKSFTLTVGGKTVELTRQAYESPSVTGRLLPDKKTALVRIESFNNDTAPLFKKITADLVKQGARAFVYDLRGNPGGSLTSVTEVLDYLLPEGVIVTMEHYDGTKEEHRSDKNFFDYPSVVLINGSTASAGELFSACLRDYGAAKLVGETTYGKGVAQSIFPLPDGSAVKFTTAKYYSPKTPNYDGVGLKPDIEVKTPETLTDFAHTNVETDPQVQKAVEQLK